MTKCSTELQVVTVDDSCAREGEEDYAESDDDVEEEQDELGVISGDGDEGEGNIESEGEDAGDVDDGVEDVEVEEGGEDAPDVSGSCGRYNMRGRPEWALTLATQFKDIHKIFFSFVFPL